MSQKALPDNNEIRYLNVHEKTERMTELEARFGERIEDWLWQIRWQEKRPVQWIARTAGVSYSTIRNWLDSCHIKRRSMKEVWGDPDYRARVCSSMQHAQKKNWEDPFFRKHQSQQRSQRSKKMWRDPSKRKRIIQLQREGWENSNLKERQAQRMSQRSKKWWQDKDYRERQLQRLSHVRKKDRQH